MIVARSSGLTAPRRVSISAASVFRRKVDGAWRDVTATQFRDEVVDLAKGLVAAGVKPGDRVGILSATRYEWTLFDFAIWAAGTGSPRTPTASWSTRYRPPSRRCTARPA